MMIDSRKNYYNSKGSDRKSFTINESVRNFPQSSKRMYEN